MEVIRETMGANKIPCMSAEMEKYGRKKPRLLGTQRGGKRR